eukprot:g10595.t1
MRQPAPLPPHCEKVHQEETAKSEHPDDLGLVESQCQLAATVSDRPTSDKGQLPGLSRVQYPMGSRQAFLAVGQTWPSHHAVAWG